MVLEFILERLIGPIVSPVIGSPINIKCHTWDIPSLVWQVSC